MRPAGVVVEVVGGEKVALLVESVAEGWGDRVIVSGDEE